MARGDIHWAVLSGVDRRPFLVVTRTGSRHSKVTVATITRTVRGIASELNLGPREGLGLECVANVDDLHTLPVVQLDPERVGRLTPTGHRRLDAALVYALGIRHAE